MSLYADLGGRRAIPAQWAGSSIAVEIKSFDGKSLATDIYHAVGQYMVYRILMERSHPDRRLYLALTQEAFDEIMNRSAYRLVFNQLRITMVIVDQFRQEVIQWL